jgi:sulfhydrogenase subunit beta (sulfur reductase)
MTFFSGYAKFIVYIITMMLRYTIDRKNWDKTLEEMLFSFDVYASVENDFGQDYEQVTRELIPKIVYNTPKPATPLKSFFLPVRENVSTAPLTCPRRIVIGIPNCDLEGLKLLDEIYLDKDYTDPFYQQKREHTILISSDCFSRQDHCHCTTYGVTPFSEGNGDLSLALIDGKVIVSVFSEKGKNLLQEIKADIYCSETDPATHKLLEERHAEVISRFSEANILLPDYKKTGDLINKSQDEIWKKYASHCVSCGACATICPTCTCFLLIDRPDFEKVKQVDACQYPGFERVAGGEDALHHRFIRFRNRYLCKYFWKPQKFQPLACTGCGRCIEACIGHINKNELFVELTKTIFHGSEC